MSFAEDWAAQMPGEFNKPYMKTLKSFLKTEKAEKKLIYPDGKYIFEAFKLTSFEKVKVVVIGQDPYHGPNQAHGLSFSVRPGVSVPPSLLNIYKELESDIGIRRRQHGYLEHWAKQGVLLLNSVLTVEAGQAASHQGKGWEIFTDAVVELLNEKKEHLVFMLWGSYAIKKGAAIDASKHHIITSTHPSPLSAHRGFLGSKPFSKANAYLLSSGIEPIDWQLPQLAEVS